jgi:hypothetical protein
MKRIIIAVIIGVLAGVISIPLALLPNVFNSVGASAFNQNLRLTWFLGCALQGLLAAGLLVASLQKVCKSPSVGRALQAWGLTALLGVIIPAPSILNGKYADGLTGWYAVLVCIASAIFVWTHWPVIAKKEDAEPIAAPLPSDGAPSEGR